MVDVGLPRELHSRKNRAIVFLYVVLLGLSSAHLYRKPVYAMDSAQYIGNALLMEERDIVKLHHRVYQELGRSVPDQALRELLGDGPAAPQDQNNSRRIRARDPYRFAEFLPLFAIRPLYNQILWLTSKLGFGMIRSAILVSVVSYFVLGILLLCCISRYAGMALGAVLSFLLMVSPPLYGVGKRTYVRCGSDVGSVRRLVSDFRTAAARARRCTAAPVNLLPDGFRCTGWTSIVGLLA